MSKTKNHVQNRKMAFGRRASALGRIELRQPTDQRQSAAGPTSLAIKTVDADTRRAIDEFMARKDR